MTPAFADLLLAYLLRGGSAPVSSSLYLGLSTVVPSDDAGTGWTELAYTGYARLAISRATGSWAAPSAGQSVSAAAATWTVIPSGATGRQAAAWGLWTAASGGTLISWARLATVYSLPVGSTPTLPAGALAVAGVA